MDVMLPKFSEAGGDNIETVEFTGTYHNLLRVQADSL